ncbi:MAG TPA: type II secretion system protein [Planctomycetota bacterium]|nr:type II secretion system protein [Planctomycetota bacterium]
MTRRHSYFCHTKPRGFSVPELIVVVAIMVILSASLISGYVNMQKNQRMKSATERFVTILHTARSLAITNNAVYHVYIDNWQPGVTTGQRFDDQSISIQCYPEVSRALRINDELDMGITTDRTLVQAEDFPSSLSTSPQVAQAMIAALDTQLASAVSPQREALLLRRKGYTNERDTMPYNDDGDPPTDRAFTNWRVDHVRFTNWIYVGVQNDLNKLKSDPAVVNPPVLSFLPDGTASTTLQFYVTDDENLADDKLAVLDTTPEDLYQKTNNTRWQVFYEANDPLLGKTLITSTTPTRARRKDAQVSIIQVFRGGIIKVLQGGQP